jgi:hypothetical protein
VQFDLVAKGMSVLFWSGVFQRNVDVALKTHKIHQTLN